MKASTTKRVSIPLPKPNQLLECRGGTWRFVKEEKGFWELELIKQGAQFTQTQTRVWALPELERTSLKILEDSEALAPLPTDDQRENSRLYKPLLYAQRNHSLQDATNSKEPITALNCAIEHKTWQFEPWRRIVDVLPFPRLLIADDVGLGKTTEAAIVLAELASRRRADRILIIAPHHLAEKWQDELYERFGLAFEIFNRETRTRLTDRGVKNPWEVVERVIVSRDFVKRWENLKPLSHVNWDVVVIDECHHFVRENNKAPNRLRELAEKIVYRSPGLLLLSATPFTGSSSEFMSLLRLIDPSFHDEAYAKTWDSKNPHLLRRLKGDVQAFGEQIQSRVIKQLKIEEKDLSKEEKQALTLVQRDFEKQRSKPNRDSWDRLVEETARKRLSSSWAAFIDSISGDRRLSTWFSSDTKAKVTDLIAKSDSAKLRALASVLKEIFRSSNKSKVVIFTEAIPTQDYIASFLTTVEGFAPNEIAVIKGDTSRDERISIEDNFANPASTLRVLIATDTISEGKDLQHACNHLIHFELPWSLVRIEQRNGRIDRLGQKNTPTIINLVLDTPATPDQRVIGRLLQKLEQARETLGSVSPIVQCFEEIDLSESSSTEATEAMLEKEIDRIVSETKAFENTDESENTSLSSSPMAEAPSPLERQRNSELMLRTLGGDLRPYGETKEEFLLSLPEDWEQPELIDLVGDLPTMEKPWRITFSPKVFLEYERFRREHGEGKAPLHFVSPVHPLYVQLESRFRSRLSLRGYPIFAVADSLHPEIILVELTARSNSSRIMSQKLAAFDLVAFNEMDISVLTEFKSLDGPAALPSREKWKRVEATLARKAKEFATEIHGTFSKKLRDFEVKKTSDSSYPGSAERAAWLQELWGVNTENSQFQILALLVNKEKK